MAMQQCHLNLSTVRHMDDAVGKKPLQNISSKCWVMPLIQQIQAILASPANGGIYNTKTPKA